MTTTALPVTITVRALRAQHDGAEVLVQIVLDNGEHREQKSLPLTMEQYCTIKPQKGVISEETYERIEEASQLCLALRSGENLLSYGSNSVHHLARKLMQRGYSRDVAAQAARRLEETGLINESEDVRREVERCLRKLWGEKRITAHLWSRGFAAEALHDVPALFSEVDFVQNCTALIRKKYGDRPADRDEFRRMTASLARYGYSIGQIREACKAFN